MSKSTSDMKNCSLLIITFLFTAILSSYAAAPSITSYSPASGPVGTMVTISGTNLGSPTSLTIGGTAAIVVSNTGTSLVGLVMPGAATGTVSITTAGGTATGTGSFAVTGTFYPSVQQGSKLVGTGYVAGNVNQGNAVAISADGNTAIVGGYYDNSDTGAVWIYTRTGTTWAQQGPKLVAPDGGASYQGSSVALSADGNTAMVGGSYGSGGTGGSWIWTRSGGVWTVQGPKLLGTGTTGNAYQGASVSLSADGNTALVGGASDNTGAGAVWIFKRTGNTWTQQGPKLVGTGAVGKARQGFAAQLSADGNTAVVGGWDDNGAHGAAWIWTRTDTTWTQQGPKLVGSSITALAYQGYSVGISGNGNTAIIGGYAENTYVGGVWIFTRTDTTWRQQGPMLVGYDTTAWSHEGISVSISADGNTAIAGGLVDNNSTGATWVWTRTDTTWSQRGPKLVGTGATGSADQGSAVAISADGSTAIVGGIHDNYAGSNATGAAWIFATACASMVTPSVSLGTTGSMCSGAPVSITATPANGGTSPVYQWYLNGVLQSGSTATYTSSSFSNHDSVWCVLTSNATCVSPAIARSTHTVLSISAAVTPTISIAPSANAVCAGSPATFTASITNGGTTPSYQWEVNGTNVGSNSSTYTGTVSGMDSVWCVMTSTASCAVPAAANSNKSTVTINPKPSPVAALHGIDSLSTGTFASYQWLLNNSPISGATAQTYVSTQSGSYRVIVFNAQGCSDTSAVVSVTHVGIQNIQTSEVRIYPNPTENILHIEADGLHNNTTLILIDAIGRNVYESNIAGNSVREALDISSLASGMYILMLKDQDKVYVSRRIVKN